MLLFPGSFEVSFELKSHTHIPDVRLAHLWRPGCTSAAGELTQRRRPARKSVEDSMSDPMTLDQSELEIVAFFLRLCMLFIHNNTDRL